jgi:23S rRNA (pseudouridine1915-N3)-methyltransferase
MYKVKIFSIGKTKEPWLSLALEEYSKRLKPSLSIEWCLAKQDEQLALLLDKEAHYICLDPQGKAFSSEAFSAFLHQKLLEGGSRLSFVIGGAEGLPEPIKRRAAALLSLSPLTFTHQLTRLILLEQLYRSLEIAKGSSYHK